MKVLETINRVISELPEDKERQCRFLIDHIKLIVNSNEVGPLALAYVGAEFANN
jgi:hypothetical protein